MKEPTNIRIVEGNAFTLALPLVSRTFVNKQPQDEAINAAELQDVRIKVNGQAFTGFVLDTRGVLLSFGGDLPKNVYDVELAATYHGSPIRAAWYHAFTIVTWNEQSDMEGYIQGSPLVIDMPVAYILAGGFKDEILQAIAEQTEQLQGEDPSVTLTVIKIAIADVRAYLVDLREYLADRFDSVMVYLRESYAFIVGKIGDIYARQAEYEGNAIQRTADAIEHMNTLSAQERELVTAAREGIYSALALLRVGLQGGDSQATLAEVKYLIEQIVIPAFPTDYAKQEAMMGAFEMVLTQLDKKPTKLELATALGNLQTAIIQAMPSIPTDYAKEATLGASTDTSAAATIFGKIAGVLVAVQAIATDYARRSDIPTDYATAQALADALTALQTALSPKATAQDVTDAKNAIIAAIPSVSALATSAEVSNLAAGYTLATLLAAIRGTDNKTASDIYSYLLNSIAKESTLTTAKSDLLTAITNAVTSIKNGTGNTIEAVLTILATAATKSDLTSATNEIKAEMTGKPSVMKLTMAQFDALQVKDEKTIYYITDNGGLQVITRYIGNTPMPHNQGAVFGRSAYGNALLL